MHLDDVYQCIYVAIVILPSEMSKYYVLTFHDISIDNINNHQCASMFRLVSISKPHHILFDFIEKLLVKIKKLVVFIQKMSCKLAEVSCNDHFVIWDEKPFRSVSFTLQESEVQILSNSLRTYSAKRVKCTFA